MKADFLSSCSLCTVLFHYPVENNLQKLPDRIDNCSIFTNVDLSGLHVFADPGDLENSVNKN